jgi:hypothetical protein
MNYFTDLVISIDVRKLIINIAIKNISLCYT